MREQLAGMLSDRIMVAHNAQFDYDFLAGEFGRIGTKLPVRQRLCTWALARRVALPTPDYKLGTLAAHYGIRQTRAHDALDDTRVLAGVLRGLIADATHLGIAPPLLECTPKQSNRHLWRGKAKAPCGFAYPGRFEPGGRLIQGMKVAFTGNTRVERNDLIDRAEVAGLEVMSSVSGRTSLLVSNTPDSASTKAERARSCGTPVVSEELFLRLLAEIVPGQPKGAAAQAGTPPQQIATSRKSAREPAGPLAGRRILVLGGTHDRAAEIRRRIAELGGSAAVNMSAGVTDILALPGAERDPRHKKAVDLGLPIRGIELLGANRGEGAQTEQAAPMEDPHTASAAEATVLAHGQVIDLPVGTYGGDWTLRASWRHTARAEIDVVAFLLDECERVASDDDFVFYNQPQTDGARLSVDGPNEQAVLLDLDALPDHCRRIVLAAAIDGPGVTFGDIGAVEIEVESAVVAGTFARATLDAATEERVLLLAEIYLRGENWRLRAVGQGYTTDLAALAYGYGVDVSV